jgi:hypothetical protein
MCRIAHSPSNEVGTAGQRAGACPLKGTAGVKTWRALAVLLSLLPATVLACPSCTARAPESATGAGVLLGALMLVPLLLVGMGVWAARRAMRAGADTAVETERV